MGMDFKGRSVEAKDCGAREAECINMSPGGKILGLLLKLEQLKVPQVHLICWLSVCGKLPG